ncbi:carbohydrate ABC transporter permease [Deinococcus pimensis]|uniref:carbohydrate ABC transporter permease n=1 Tax=Deinococcus pimensis TaxID=309888 RepID=UPI0004AFED03|nr:sugar ABC transporter permease [Deinococcus pimensis]
MSAPPVRPRRRGLGIRQREALWGFVFVAPWLVGFLAFTVGPMLFSLYASFTNYDITSRADWVGLRNYQTLVGEDPRFWKSLGNTAYYTVFSVPLGIAVGLLIASLLNQDVPGQRVFRTVFFLPKILTGVAVLLLWLWVFNPEVGLVNNGLRAVGVPENSLPLWFQDPAWSKPALVIMSMWSAAGGFLFYLAALRGVPKDLYESAQLDGANSWRQFLTITIPMISPVIFFKVITGLTAALQYWEGALVVSEGGKGGPVDSTLFYGLYMWETAFTEFRMGKASAMAWVLLVITLVITAVQLQLSKRWVYYEGETK